MKRVCLCTRLLVAACFLAALPASAGRGRHKKLYVTPTPGKVAIDGKLDDWDLSGQIHVYVSPETAEMQSARLAMMYDAEALYISAEVRDASPMMNRHDPKVDPHRAWDADVLQLFLSVDPDLGFPLKMSRWQDGKKKNLPLATFMLWYYTDRRDPNICAFRGFKWKEPLRPDLGTDGVFPHDTFSARYVKAADGKGYTFEYRIPWKTMGLENKPEANDLLCGVACIFWSRPDGLKTAGGPAWAYDVMAKPGFPWQSTDCWGHFIFAKEGNINPALVEEGLPPEKPLPLRFTYDLPRDGEVTVQLFDESNMSQRILVAQDFRRAGENVERWDGLDHGGDPLPAGTYTWKGIIHDPIKQKYLFSPHNSGKPTYHADDNTGGWGGDHGSPTTCCAMPGGGMLLAWSGAENGWGIIRVNAKGRKLWGSKHSATDPDADPKRKKPAPDDLGILVTRQDGKPFAVVYRPKVARLRRRTHGPQLAHGRGVVRPDRGGRPNRAGVQGTSRRDVPRGRDHPPRGDRLDAGTRHHTRDGRGLPLCQQERHQDGHPRLLAEQQLHSQRSERHPPREPHRATRVGHGRGGVA